MSVESEQQLAATRERRAGGLARRERVVDGALGIGFLLVAFALTVSVDADSIDWGVAVAFTLAFALAGLVEFHTGTGYTNPTQLVFVPMLFAMDPALVPLLVGVGAAVGKLPSVLIRRIGAERWVLGVADAWFCVAPVLILMAADVGAPDLDDLPVLALAFGAQAVVDSAISSVRAWACLGAPPLKVVREVLWIYRVDGLLTPIGILAGFAAAEEPYAGLLVLPLIGLFAIFAREREDRIDKQLELERAYRGTAMLLGDVIEDDDAYTGEHTRGVVGLSLAVGRELELDEENLRDCEFGALLHDVGKVRIPNEIINKPGPLDDEEWAIMRTHTIEGQRMLARVGGVLGRVGEVVRASHERWDGRGYPDALITDQIPIAARIISACDAYNAMTTDRSYRKAMPPEVALAEMEACSGSQFDPQVVSALVRVLDAERAARKAHDTPDPAVPALRAVKSTP